jgi:hypothetical protein
MFLLKKLETAFLPEYLIQLLWLVHLKGLVEGVGYVLGLQLLASPEEYGRNYILLTKNFQKYDNFRENDEIFCLRANEKITLLNSMNKKFAKTMLFPTGYYSKKSFLAFFTKIS